MSRELSTKEHLELTEGNLDVAVRRFEAKEYSALNGALIGLFREARREAQRLLLNLENLTLVSLSVRNLFEILLISKHIYFSEKALVDWYGQCHKDSKEVKDAFIKLMEKQGMDSSELKEIQKFEDESLAQSPFQSKGGFQVRNLADKYGYIEDYKFVYKLSSKLVHPSSMKIMAYTAVSEDANYLRVVHHIAVYFGKELSLFLHQALEENA